MVFVSSFYSLYVIELPLWHSSRINTGPIFLLDSLRIAFVLRVVLISFSVIRFSQSYIKTRKQYNKFHFLILVFVASILILVLRPNLFFLILGWDGLGISSFFLVIFYSSGKSFNAGLITGLTNRVGDALILVSLILIIFIGNSRVYFSEPDFSSPQMFLILLIFAAITKRAQVPFRAWLPAAIAAPTPVSALVHSSTLVTAGVYLLIRLNFLNQKSSNLRVIIASFGALTILLARLSALKEVDIKKIIALSTLSQLGVIFMALALKNRYIVIFHLLAHAFFKALLFIRAGNLIHNSNDYQDLRRFGRISSEIAFSSTIVIVTKVRLCGLPFFSAFFSKELVLESIVDFSSFSLGVYYIIWLGVILTALYSLRFITQVIIQRPQCSRLISISDNDLILWTSIIILLVPAFFGGKFISLLYLPYFFKPVIAPTAKVITLLSLLVVTPFIFYSLSQKPKFPFFASVYIWGLPFWRGFLPSQNNWKKLSNVENLVIFRALDYFFLNWFVSTTNYLFLSWWNKGLFFKLILRLVLITVILLLLS